MKKIVLTIAAALMVIGNNADAAGIPVWDAKQLKADIKKCESMQVREDMAHCISELLKKLDPDGSMRKELTEK